MPLYGSLSPLTAVNPGESVALFNAEVLVAPATSMAVGSAPGPGGAMDRGSTFTIDFAAAPTSSVLIQASNIDVEADYQTLYTSASTQHDNYSVTVPFRFYRCKLASQSAGGALTVILSR